MRTPAQMAEDVNNLNCHAGGGGYGPVTVAQMEAVYAEARKIEWTDRKPDKVGWWLCLGENTCALEVKMDGGELWVHTYLGGDIKLESVDERLQWSTRPIDMPEEARKELSK